MADTVTHRLIVVGERDALLGWHHIMRRQLPELGLPDKKTDIKHSALATSWCWDAQLPLDDEDTNEAIEALRQTLYATPDICAKWISWVAEPFRVVDQTCFHAGHPMMEVVHNLLFFRGTEPGGEPNAVLPWSCRWTHVTAVESLAAAKKKRRA